MSKSTNKKLKEALLNKALGYTTQEITEEYGISGDDFVLQKRKMSTKSYPPDLSALQILLDEEVEFNEFEKKSDDELKKEKERIVNLIIKEKR
jgi:hypothetical protein